MSYKIFSCVTALLLFLHHFFTIVASLTFSNGLSDFAQSVSRDIKLLQRTIVVNRSQFIQYVICPKCHSVYNPDSCIITEGNRKESKCCQHISFPNHPQLAHRSKCSKPLMKTVRGKKHNISAFQIFLLPQFEKSTSRYVTSFKIYRCVKSEGVETFLMMMDVSGKSSWLLMVHLFK